MDIQTIETVINIAQNSTVQDSIQMLVSVGGVIWGKSFLTAAGIATGGIGLAWACVTAVASEICARTKTRDSKAYKVVELLARNNETAKEKA